MLCFGLNCPFGLFLRSRHRDWNLRTSPGNGSPSQPWYKHRFQKAVATVPSAQIPTQLQPKSVWPFTSFQVLAGVWQFRNLL
jgi:hypothetical protein